MFALVNSLAAAGFAQNDVAKMLSVLRAFGTDAHLYLPGPGIPILGPELVTNGDFGDGANGWAPVEATLTVVNGEAVLQSIGSVYGRAIQSFEVVSGKEYCISVAHRNGTTNDGWLLAGSASGAYDYWLPSTLVGNSNATFVAKSNTLHLAIQNDNLIANAISYHDNVSVKEILGYTNTINGITAGNYLDSIGTTHASVDDLVGLVLDAAGSVGPELVTTPSIAAVGIGGPAFTNYSTGASVVAGKTYKISYTISGYSGSGNVGFAGTVFNGHSAATANGTYVNTMAATGSGAVDMFSRSTNTCQFSGITVKEVTGIHATQATTGNKPTLRRGLVNLLAYSTDLTNAAWIKSGGFPGTVVPGGYQLVGTQGAYRYIYQNKTHTAGVIKTFVVKVRSTTPGATNPFRLAYGASGTNYSSVMQTTDNFAFYTVTFTSSATDVVAFTSDASNSAFDVVIESFALVDGTLTASQILAAGGIPLTTTAPASSSAGAYKWEFDGTDDFMSLGSIPFQIADDHYTAIALTPNAINTGKHILNPANGAASQQVGNISVDGNSKYITRWCDDATNVLWVADAVTVAPGVASVLASRRVGTTGVLRKNGAQVGSISLASIGATTLTLPGVIGSYKTGANPSAISLHGVAVIKGTVTDAQALIFERGLNALSNYAVGRF